MGKGPWTGRGQVIDTIKRDVSEIEVYITGAQLKYIFETLLSVQTKQKMQRNISLECFKQ